MFVFAGFTWALWTTKNRNMMIGSGALSYLQKWSVLLKDDDRERLEMINGEILNWMKTFKPNDVLDSDICEV